MKIDLHIHSSSCSDGLLSLDEIFNEAGRRGIHILSITDHDSIDCQESAMEMAREFDMAYVTGLELNVSFTHSGYLGGKAVSLDFLAYDFDIHNNPLGEKLRALRDHRRRRAEKILNNINVELSKAGRPTFDEGDMAAIEASVDGAFGRPHIANYMVRQGVVANRQEAFDRYLVRCNEPKMPVSLEEAAELVHGAGGKIVLAHANDPNGTSLVKMTTSLEEQQHIIRSSMIQYIDGVECWHSRHDPETIESYLAFAKKEGLLVTGGSDCHQQPILMGSLDIPAYVAKPFGMELEKEEEP